MKRKIFIAIGIVAGRFGRAGRREGAANPQDDRLRARPSRRRRKPLPPPWRSEEKWQDTLTAVGSVERGAGRDASRRKSRARSRKSPLNPARRWRRAICWCELDTSSEEAQLRAAEAQVELAKLNAERTRTLRADNTVSQSELDTGRGDVEAERRPTPTTSARPSTRKPSARRSPAGWASGW